MIEISGYYFDGKTPNRKTVTIQFYRTGEIKITGDELVIEQTLTKTKISPRIGNTCRSVYFEDGAKLESFANDELDTISHYFRQNDWQALVHRLEAKFHYAIVAVLITIFSLWAGIEYGVPITAKWAAKNIPFSVEQKIGKEGLETLDKILLNPSKLDELTQQRLNAQFQASIESLENASHYQLVFRYSEQLGANALALPSGIIIVTDGLVEIAENDEQIIAIVGHELGHVIYNHGIRAIFQNSLTALLMAGLLGDVSSISSVAATLPTILVDMRYSRQFEREADDYALVFLEKNNINVDAFAQILAHLQKTLPKGSELGYLSSHPAMAERIKRVNDSTF